MKLRTLTMITASMVAISTAALAQTATTSDKPTPLTPEQRQVLHQEHQADREAFREKLKNATPEERQKLIAERKAEWQKRYDAASPEQKARMDKHREEWKEHHEERAKERQQMRAERQQNRGGTGAPATPGDTPAAPATH